MINLIFIMPSAFFVNHNWSKLITNDILIVNLPFNIIIICLNQFV